MGANGIQKSNRKNYSWSDNVCAGQFPAGLKVLIIDDDRTCLHVLERMLRKLLHEVTKCQVARDALALLQEDTSRFDIVICDLYMPDMDGFKLLEIIGSEMDLPVVLMSSDDRNGVVMKAIIRGACDYLVKPIRMDAIRFLWQHVIRRRKCTLEGLQWLQNVNVDNELLLAEEATGADLMPATENGSIQSLKPRREDEAEDELDKDEDEDGGESSYDNEEATNGRKRRMIWTREIHDLFVAALNQLGDDKCVPKKILECMRAMNPNIDLTRANIASHLQKYRLHLRKLDQHLTNGDINALFERAASRFRQRRDAHSRSCPQLPLQNLITPPTSRSETANENPTTAPSSDNGSRIFDPIISESSPSLPSEFSLHGFSTNSLYQNYDLLDSVVISEDYMHIDAIDQLLDPLPAVDDLIYQPSFLFGQFDQDDIFRGPFQPQ